MTQKKFSKVDLIEQPGKYLMCNNPKNIASTNLYLKNKSLNLNGEDIFKYLLMANRDSSARIIVHQKTEGIFRKVIKPARLELKNPFQINLNDLVFGVCVTTFDDKNYFVYSGSDEDYGIWKYEFGIQEVEDVEIKNNCMRPLFDKNLHSHIYVHKEISETKSKENIWKAEIDYNCKSQPENLIKSGLNYLNSAIADLKILVWKENK